MASATLRNENHDNVHLQVTAGDSLDGGENTVVFNRNVPQHWSSPFNFPTTYLFFRRNGDPDNTNSAFTDWVSLSEGEDRDIAN